MRIFMQLPVSDDRAPRFYQLVLQPDLLGGWTLIREWGQAGSPGRVRRELFAAREDAERALVTVRDAQVKRGYRVVYTEGQ
ncbi:MAG: WGR domain-containing protein [Pseudomonadota bacterium]|nr:MAG: WGR domain-containing protein [Pseudomonadota bacterium]